MKRYQPLISKSSPITRILPFLKISHPTTPPYRHLGQPKFSLLTEIQQQHNVGFFIFKFTLKCMLGNVYINKIHATQCLYIISLYYREGFFPSFQFLCCIQRNPSYLISKQLRRKDFSMEQLPNDSYMLLCKQKNYITINQ